MLNFSVSKLETLLGKGSPSLTEGQQYSWKSVTLGVNKQVLMSCLQGDVGLDFA